MHQRCMQQNNNIHVGMLTGDKCKSTHTECSMLSTEQLKDTMINEGDLFFEKHNVVIYTPCIKTGF